MHVIADRVNRVYDLIRKKTCCCQFTKWTNIVLDAEQFSQIQVSELLDSFSFQSVLDRIMVALGMSNPV